MQELNIFDVKKNSNTEYFKLIKLPREQICGMTCRVLYCSLIWINLFSLWQYWHDHCHTFIQKIFYIFNMSFVRHLLKARITKINVSRNNAVKCSGHYFERTSTVSSDSNMHLWKNPTQPKFNL